MSATATWGTIFVVIQFVICLLGICFNGLVILVILKNVSRLSPESFLVLNIAVSDFFSCLVAIPISITAHLQKEWPFGLAGCQAHAFMVFLFALVSITNLAAISAAKYLTISRSLSKESYFNRRQIQLIILASWFYSLAFSVAPLVGWSRYGSEGTEATCSIKWDSTRPSDKAYFAVVFLACFFLPTGMIAVCYYKIHIVSKRIVQNIQRPMGGGRMATSVTQALLKKHRRSAMYFLAIVVVFLFSWSPYAVVSLLVAILGKTFNAIVTSACSVFSKTSFLSNPIMYAIVSQRFRRRIISVIVPLTRRNPEGRRPVVVPTSSHQLAL